MKLNRARKLARAALSGDRRAVKTCRKLGVVVISDEANGNCHFPEGLVRCTRTQIARYEERNPSPRPDSVTAAESTVKARR